MIYMTTDEWHEISKLIEAKDFPKVDAIMKPGETLSINTTLDNIKEDTTK